MFTEIFGYDLFQEDHNFGALGHGVNLAGVMGAGVALEFRKRYPGMFGIYHGMCKSGQLRPGGVYAYLDEDLMYIYNCATQVNPGPNADYALIALSAHHMLDHARNHRVTSIGIPTIGCGIGGLSWPKVRYIYESVFSDTPVNLVVVHREQKVS